MARAGFLHLADLHLSRPFGFLPPQLAEERRRDQRRALTRIADLAIERSVDIVLIAGDLFDTSDPDPTDVEAAIADFSRLADAGKRIFAIPGNHDIASRNSFWESLANTGVHVFSDTEWSSVALDDLGIAVHGIAFNRSKSDRRAFDGFKMIDGLSNIVLVHASYEAFEGQLEKYHPFSAEEVARTKASYIALGHYHRFNQIAADGVTACYTGTPEGISFDAPETDDRFVILGEIDDGEVKIEPIKTNLRIMRRAEIDCTSFDSQTTLFDAVRRFCEPNALVGLKFTGTPISELMPILEDLPARFRESCLYMSVDTTGITMGGNFPLDDLTIRGRFCRHMLNQIEDAADPERRRLFRRALDIGLAAFDEV